MKIRYFLRSWILKTSTLIIFSTLVTMLIMFLIIGSSLYRHLSAYILEQSTKYTDSIAEQVQQRLNSTLSEIDSNIQQLCNDIQIQNILYRSQNNNVLSSEDQMTLRQKVMETLNYTDAVQQIEIYTAASPHQIYPFAQKSIFDFLTKTELDLIDEQNGKIVWLSNTKQENSYIRAGKRLLLSDYQFVHGGYLVMLLRPDFLEFFQEDFQQFSNSAVFLKDTTGNLIYFSSNNPEISIDTVTSKSYRFVTSTSAYTNWELTICIPLDLLNQDLPWLNQTLLATFGMGATLSLFFCLLIARMISAPIRDMKKAMYISNGKLQKNFKVYWNSDMNELNLHYNQLVDKNNELIQEVFEKEIMKTKAEIEALQSQVNPHFIINALESVYWCLIKKGDLENSQIMLSLARLFRYILKANDWISIQEELDFIDEYLQIEKFRFGQKLQWSYDVEPSLKTMLIPKLFIHPLIENSVKHAVEATSTTIRIHLLIRQKQSDVEIVVSDNGMGISQDVLDQILLSFQDDKPVGSVSQSYGLANLYKRIHLYFGETSSLSVESCPDYPGTRIRVQIKQ